ncbi:major facilitator superfamily domain-containing protein [Cenococcum geophilum]
MLTTPSSSTNKRFRTSVTPSQLPFFIVIGSLFFGTFLVALDATIIGTALPAITTEYRSLDDIGWYGSAYLLTLTALQPTFGRLFAMWNTKAIYLLCVLVFEGKFSQLLGLRTGSILCAAAPTSTAFIVGRAIQGCGAAGILQGALVIITRTVSLEKRPFYISIVISAFGLCVKIGPLIGGAFTQNVTWRWCFWINVPIGAVVFVLLQVFLKLEPRTDKENRASRSYLGKLKTIDLGGMVLIIGSICALLLAMQWGGQTMPWSSSKIIGLFVGSGFMFAFFILFQYKLGNNATLPFSILFQRSILSGALYLFFFAMPTYVYGYYLPIYFQSVKGFSALRSGIDFLALALPQIGFTVLAGWLASRFGYYTPYLIGGTLISIPGSYLLTTLDLGTNLGTWVAYFLVIAIGTGLSINHPYTAVQAVLNESDVPIGNAIMQFTFSLGGALSLCIAQTIFVNKLSYEIRHNVSGVSVEEVLAAGAYSLSDISEGSPGTLLALRRAYRNALRDVFIFALAASGAALLSSLFFEHLNLKVVAKNREQKEAHADGLAITGDENLIGGKLSA